MDYLKSFPALGGLVDLANRNDVDVRPTLLRVLTDLYVTKPVHTREEERQYTELALRLLDAVDITARYHVAQRLAVYAQAPRVVVRRLARDVIAVAEPILSRSRTLSLSELLAIGQETSPSHVAAVGARGDTTPQDQQKSPGTIAPSSELFAGRDVVASELSDLFFAANATERRLILLNLDFAPFAPAKPISATLANEAARRLEIAALSHNIETLVRELARALSISHSLARQLIDDTSGEPMVVAAKALGIPADVLQRILLCLNPEVGQSVQRIYDLADLFDELKPEAGLRLVAIWQASDAAKPLVAKPVRHQSQVFGERIRPRPNTVQGQRRPEQMPLPRFGKKQG